MIKFTVMYQMFKFKIMELVVGSQPISIYDAYDLCWKNILGSSYPDLAENRIYSSTREDPPSRASVWDENEKDEKWPVKVEEDDIDI
jgi:hypothetical protein